MSSKNNDPKAPGYISLIAAGEPFRLLFPIGTAIGILGVMMWPLYAWKITATYPGVAHSRIMMEGFLTCFVVGFLGTALPRLLGVPRIMLGETLGFAIALVSIAWLQFSGRTLWGDELFFFTLAWLVIVLVARTFLRKDTPPPAFLLVGMGILSALAGAAIQALAQIAPTSLSDTAGQFGRLLLNQGYILLPVMGIGAFIMPRFFDLPNRQSFPESPGLPPGWKSSAAFAFLCGAGVVASFYIEAVGGPRWGCALRASAVMLYFFREVPVYQAGFSGGTLALGLRVSLFAIPAGFILMAFSPSRIITFVHIVYITGFSLLTFIIASRVVLGHSGQSEKFKASLKPVLLMMALVTLAMLSRVTAGLMPAMAISHYAYAAVAWIAGVLVWAFTILPGIRTADT